MGAYQQEAAAGTRRMRVLRRAAALALLTLPALAAGTARAAEHVKIAAFQGASVNLPVYIAKDLKLFEKHGIDAELLYGTGIQVTNIMVSGSADFGAFAVEHGLLVKSKGQDIKLLVLDQTATPFNLILRNDVPTPNAGAPYPGMLKDLKGLKIGISTPGASTDETLRFLLQQAGLDPQKDVKIVPVGAANTQVAGLKNGLIDADMAFEPAQTVALYGLKIAKSMLDIQGGQGPEIFHDYAYNGVFARTGYIKEHPAIARGIVAAIVEAEQMMNDPAQLDTVAKVAIDNMKGIDPPLLRGYIEKYHSIFTPVATPKAIANVNAMLIEGKQIAAPVSYDEIVAPEFMPREFSAAKSH